MILALGLGGTLMARDGAKLYDIDSTIITWWHFGAFKSIARQFQEVVPPGDVTRPLSTAAASPLSIASLAEP